MDHISKLTMQNMEKTKQSNVDYLLISERSFRQQSESLEWKVADEVTKDGLKEQEPGARRTGATVHQE